MRSAWNPSCADNSSIFQLVKNVSLYTSAIHCQLLYELGRHCALLKGYDYCSDGQQWLCLCGGLSGHDF